MQNEISVVIFANSKDFFLTKICVASIRYYYPDVEILLVKDLLNGKFSSRALEKKFNVKTIKLKKKYFGWGSAKVHFSLDYSASNKRYLILDSDIFFTGRLLDRLNKIDADFILHPEIYEQPFDEIITSIFVDPDVVKKDVYPTYEYPGYFFNTGQLVLNPSLFNEQLLEKCFDKNRYPYFTNRKVFNMVDQSVFNAVLPIIFKESNCKYALVDFMKWSKSFFEIEENNKLELFLDGKLEYLVHYAGDVRELDLSKMAGSSILYFFKGEYEKKLNKMQTVISRWQDKLNANKHITRVLYLKNAVLLKFLKVN